jgi:hypothetical protein
MDPYDLWLWTGLWAGWNAYREEAREEMHADQEEIKAIEEQMKAMKVLARKKLRS